MQWKVIIGNFWFKGIFLIRRNLKKIPPCSHNMLSIKCSVGHLKMQLFTCSLRCGFQMVSKPFLPTGTVDQLGPTWMALGTQRNISGSHLHPVLTKEHFGPPQDISLFEASMQSKFRALNNNPQWRQSFGGCTIPSFWYFEH